MDKVLLYWDNSNVFISAQDVAIEHEGPSVLEQPAADARYADPVDMERRVAGC